MCIDPPKKTLGMVGLDHQCRLQDLGHPQIIQSNKDQNLKRIWGIFILIFIALDDLNWTWICLNLIFILMMVGFMGNFQSDLKIMIYPFQSSNIWA